MTRRLTDWIDSFLEYTDFSEPAESYRLWTAISTIASVMKRKCILNWGTIRVFPNMFIILVGPPAAKKGTSMGFGIDLLYRAEIELSADSTTKEALIRAIKASYRNDIDEAGNTVHHCSYTICSPEFSVLIGNSDLQMLRYLTDWFDCGKGPEGLWTYDTKHEGADKISGIWVNLIGATTPEQIGMSPEMIGIGLASRIVFVYEEIKGKVQPYPFPSKKQLEIQEDLYHDLEEIQLMQGEFDFTKNWYDAYGPWYIEANKYPPFRDRRLAKYCERRPTHILKLCMILSACRSNEMIIRKKDLERAVSILEKTEMKMIGAFGAMGEDPKAKILSAIMREISIVKEISYSDLLKQHYFDATDPRTFESILITLEDLEWIEIKKVKTKGGFDKIIKYIGKNS